MCCIMQEENIWEQYLRTLSIPYTDEPMNRQYCICLSSANSCILVFLLKMMKAHQLTRLAYITSSLLHTEHVNGLSWTRTATFSRPGRSDSRGTVITSGGKARAPDWPGPELVWWGVNCFLSWAPLTLYHLITAITATSEFTLFQRLSCCQNVWSG